MLSPDEFKRSFVDPAVQQFSIEIDSVLHACTLIWCLDALASHVAISQSAGDLRSNPKERANQERDYKTSLIKRRGPGAWQFHVVREASNALKHGWRSYSVTGSETSDLLRLEDITAYAWYSQGPILSPIWGRQVVIELGLSFNSVDQRWMDVNGDVFEGPFFRQIPVAGLIAPVIEILGFDATIIKEKIGSDWPSG